MRVGWQRVTVIPHRIGDVFGRKKTEKTAEGDEVEATIEPVVEKKNSKTTPAKGAPTPKRRDQEAANRRPLIMDNRKEAKRAQRQAVAEERAKMRRAMETGDEKHMPYRDKGPQRRYARDFVDARYGISEWLMIMVLVFLLLSFVQIPEVQVFISVGLMVLVVVVVVEGFWVGHQLKKRLTEKFGELERGVRWYGAMRALQLRRLRLPKPQVKRGEFPR